PIVDTEYLGGPGNFEFGPAGRVAYNLNENWAIAVEEYAGLGPLRHILSTNNQFHEIWAVVDHGGRFLNLETGVGVGLTAASDKLTLKLMLSRDLHHRR